MFKDHHDPSANSAHVKPLMSGSSLDPVARAAESARDYLLDQQHPEGYWVFELEADCTIPAEYILMMHFMDEMNRPLEA